MSRPEDPPVLAPAPPRAARLRANGLIAAWLTVQLVVPIAYYAGSDPFEERFAWRMFSAQQFRDCEFAVAGVGGPGGGAPTPLAFEGEIHEWWIDGLVRNRPRVVRSVLDRVCAREELQQAHYQHRCRALDGSERPGRIVTLDCRTGAAVQRTHSP